MNRPSFRIDKINPLGSCLNKIYPRLTRMEAKHYAPGSIIISERNYAVQKFVVNKDKITEFFRMNKVTHIYINEREEKLEDNQYNMGPFKVINKTMVVISCIIA